MKNKEIENIKVYDEDRDEYNTVKLEFNVKNSYVVVFTKLGFGYSISFGFIKIVQQNPSIEDLLECMERDYWQFERYRFKELNVETFRKAKIKKALMKLC